jgi:hypothetical protein
MFVKPKRATFMTNATAEVETIFTELEKHGELALTYKLPLSASAMYAAF